MHNIEQIQLQLAQLPLENRLSVLDALKLNIDDEFERMASQALADDIAICEQRLAELDSGQTNAVSWEEVSGRVFGST
jgi:hypothetical protein